jgi:hypothetical protein
MPVQNNAKAFLAISIYGNLYAALFQQFNIAFAVNVFVVFAFGL